MTYSDHQGRRNKCRLLLCRAQQGSHKEVAVGHPVSPATAGCCEDLKEKQSTSASGQSIEEMVPRGTKQQGTATERTQNNKHFKTVKFTNSI